MSELNGFTVHILDCSLHFDSLTSKSLHKFESWLQDEVKKHKPNLLIGIGPCSTSALKSLFVIGSVCKHVCTNIPIIYGGPLASIPEFKELFFDNFNASAIVSGDGEYILLNTLSALQRSRNIRDVHGLTFKDTELTTSIIDNLDAIPFPKRPDLHKYSLSTRRNLFANPFATIIASRGCPFKCDFCVSSKLREGKYHKRSNQSIFNEIKWLIENENIKSIVFYDDTLFRNPQTLQSEIAEFCSCFESLPKPVLWELEMRPDVSLSLNFDTYATMYRSGCRQINFGIETSNSSDATTFHKSVDPDAFKQLLSQIRDNVPNLRTSGTFIIGGEGETQTTASNTVNYSLSLPITFAHYYPLEIYPGTQTYTLYKKSFCNWLEEILSDDLPWGEVIYENVNLSKQTVLNIISDAYQQFYSRKSWQDYASSIFGSHFPVILSHVNAWRSDRFGLTR